MPANLPKLPVSEAVPALMAALENRSTAVLAAPPGAGKTTLVPLHLLSARWRADARILVLEPRRLAARASARQMARLLGEPVGATVGYRTRLDTKVSARTRIEVVTEGVFVRMLLADPELPGIAAVLFDEFHERTLDADFGLALALDIRAGLRPDLRILVMSATLDVARVAALLGDAPVIESRGRAFPVEIRYRERPAGTRIEEAMAGAIRSVLAEETGSVLAFLPGQGEIKRTAALLHERLPADAIVTPLYGDLPAADQDAAIRATEPGTRKIVLATSIAETAITIDGVRVVIDSGLQRLPVFEPSTGITRLETVRVSRASAEQRAGRAGRTQPGIALRLWREAQTASLPAFTPPEITASDLSGLVLDCAAWGITDPTTLHFIDPPPAPALSEARALLHRLDALDSKGGLTALGDKMRSVGLPARDAAMTIVAGETGHGLRAAELAIVTGEPGLGGRSVDLDRRLDTFLAARGGRAGKAHALAGRIARSLGTSPAADTDAPSAGVLLLPGYADRVAGRRGPSDNDQRRYRLANGRGAFLDESDPLAGEAFLVVPDLTGKPQSQRILAAARIDRNTLVTALADQISTDDEISFDAASGQVKARRVRKLGSLVLEEAPLPRPSGEAATRALCDGLRQAGLAALPWTDASRQLRDRLDWLHRTVGDPWPAVSDKALLTTLDLWLAPFLAGVTAIAKIDPHSLAEGLLSLLPYSERAALDRLAPSHFQTPTGSRLPIRYDGDEPVLAVRVQELFGLQQHPAIADGRRKLLLELLSPARRPIQKTRDLPGFWAGSWADVRAEMRGRYPKHFWPEDPANAEATRRAKQRRKER